MPDASLDWPHLLRTWPRPDSPSDDIEVAEIDRFGDNPGNLRLLALLPDDLPPGAPLVVVLHGCTQTAAAFAETSGWVELARRHRFALLLPEQRRANNAQLCFDWFEPGDIARGKGEVASIRAMVAHLVTTAKLDRSRVFVTGLSAGGAMAAALLAVYPDVFAGGAIVAGLPFGCAASVPEALQHMHHPASRPPQEWGALVRAASPHRGPWPSVAVWHGAADHVVAPANARETLKQWLDVHGLAAVRPSEDPVAGVPHRAWRDAGGVVRVESFLIPGMDHGAPIAAASGELRRRCGSPAAFVLDVGISAAWEMVARWDLLRPAADQRSTPRAARPASPRPPSPSPRGRFAEIGQTIEQALRAAGLRRP